MRVPDFDNRFVVKLAWPCDRLLFANFVFVFLFCTEESAPSHMTMVKVGKLERNLSYFTRKSKRLPRVEPIYHALMLGFDSVI